MAERAEHPPEISGTPGIAGWRGSQREWQHLPHGIYTARLAASCERAPERALAGVRIFEDLIQNMHVRAAHKNFPKYTLPFQKYTLPFQKSPPPPPPPGAARDTLCGSAPDFLSAWSAFCALVAPPLTPFTPQLYYTVYFLYQYML